MMVWDSCPSWDHPRSRGNHPSLPGLHCQLAGSPPLAREPLQKKQLSLPIGRITPARAGTTPAAGTAITSRRDHPRSRGNHWYSKCSSPVIGGSPPLAREPLILLPKLMFNDRITPARAGTTKLNVAGNTARKDHPRSRGNHGIHSIRLAVGAGSPPLAREPQSRRPLRVLERGITPARAGTTLMISTYVHCNEDHPRSRGNHSPLLDFPTFVAGSPPLAREPLLLQGGTQSA